MGVLLHIRQRLLRSSADGEISWKKIAKIILFLAFILGILWANFMGRERTAGAGILNDYFIEKFKYASINGENLFFYIAGERLPLAVVLILLAFSSFGMALGMINLGWQGFSIGFMLSAAVSKYGARGILLIFGGMFPQYIAYMAVYTGICGVSVFLRQRRQNIIQSGKVSKEQMRLYGMGAATGVVLLLLFVTGIFLESYINPIFFKKILNFFKKIENIICFSRNMSL